MNAKLFLCLFLLTFTVGCTSSEPSSIADELDQSQIDEYNAMIEADSKASAEAGDIGKNE